MRRRRAFLVVAACGVLACVLTFVIVGLPSAGVRVGSAAKKIDDEAVTSTEAPAAVDDHDAAIPVEISPKGALTPQDGILAAETTDVTAFEEQGQPDEEVWDASADVAEPAFVMPEDASYEPQVVLASVPEGTDIDRLAEKLANTLGTVDLSEVSEGIVRVSYGGEQSVEQTVNELLGAEGVETAQPNYVYALASEGGVTESLDGESVLSDEDEDAFVVVDDDAEDAPTDESGDSVEPISADEAIEVSDDALEEDVTAEGKTGDKPIETEDGHAEAIVPLSDSEADESRAKSSADGVSLSAQAVSINDSRATEQWALTSVKAYDAWTYVKADHKVTVASLDLGCDVTHPDLQANVVDPYNSYNALHGGSTSDVKSYSSDFISRNHGTHVAGIVAATTNNGIGVSGVSYNANIMPVKVVNANNLATTDSLIKAYDFCISKRSSRNLRVINLSMGMCDTIKSDDALLKKVDEAYAKGIVTVASAGNAGASNTGKVPYNNYPSDYDKIVAVINLQQSGSGVRRYETSNYNAVGMTNKDISAPGADVLSTQAGGNYYCTMTGTSMAAPVVSGVLALEFAANPNLSATDAVTLLYATSTNLAGKTWTRSYGWGEVNAAAAAKAARDGMTSAQKAKANEVKNLSDQGAAAEVTAQIAALPATNALTIAHASKVAAARTSYNALTSKQRALVTNLSKLEAAETRIAKLKRDAAAGSNLSYRTHVQRVGWQAWKKNGETSGTTGKSLRLEAINIKVGNSSYTGGIRYQTHVQTYGWQGWKSNGQMSGTSGQSKRLEAIRIELTGELSKHYDVWYRVHAQRFGWMGWAKNGASAGTQGFSYRLEAIQIRIIPKDGTVPQSTSVAFLRRY